MLDKLILFSKIIIYTLLCIFLIPIPYFIYKALLYNNMKKNIKEYEDKKLNLEKFLNDNKDVENKIINKLDEINKLNKKLIKLKSIYDILKFSKNEVPELTKVIEESLDELISIEPTIQIKLQNENVKSLKSLFNKNKKEIDKLIEEYENRYNTKSNKSIYRLMVIALKSELQNSLYNLKYDKLDVAIDKIKETVKKYILLAESGNQAIKNTMISFISQLEYLFIEAVKIEYNYYVKKEQIRQEQLELKQRMREEAEERKKLKLEQEKIENEELKFQQELNRTKELLKNSNSNDEIEILNKKLLELEVLLSDITLKKEDIINLQNGKAGNVYIISNLGSFGENIFKIGMTRRLNPQERIDELGSASVPFKFDVHSFIFSENAVELESSIHKKLNDKRVNKVNLRKEFFYSSLEELEELVYELDPTAEFNKTMLAEEFKQSLSTDSNYESYDILNDYEDDEDLLID